MMLSLLLLCAVSSVLGVKVVEVQKPELHGTYKVMFVWPKTTKEIPNCSFVRYKPQPPSIWDFDCTCGRSDADIVMLRQETFFVGMPVLLYIAKNDEEVARAKSDPCHCEPLDFGKTVVRQLSDNLMLQYEKDGSQQLFAKVPPTEAELRDIIAGLPGVKYDDGTLVCKEE